MEEKLLVLNQAVSREIKEADYNFSVVVKYVKIKKVDM